MNRTTTRRLWSDGVRSLLPNPLTRVDPWVLGNRPAAPPPPADPKAAKK